ncbi:eukaryotic translation elongation factor 1 delta b (guanine nucleotide exchange protein) isoform X2 [Pristis pectinata]|uniref:eukaryotic translation elongation factor 1 delta b (guanine nucleotide exchange protein) isoform X2 n=1 Tax=Pristis pectinata TaxID=685728 RepID=UPI00223CA33F|nr:eukaryotic translation elongation factor 1 delta b (guanine nucleotide exchange protein) isoform X2 [Pristis pectinata]
MGTAKHPFLLETIWMDKWKFDEAERLFWVGQQMQPAPGVRPLAEEETSKRRQGKSSPRPKLVPAEEPDWHPPEEAKSDRGLALGRLGASPGPAQAKASAPSRENRPAVACHHLVCGVWVNKGAFDEAERLFVTRSQAPGVPRSLLIPSSRRIPKPRVTPDEGYISATPATPLTPGFASPQVNGTCPVTHWHLLAPGVWLEKPLYDDAERLYYEALYEDRAAGRDGPHQVPGQGGPRVIRPCPPRTAEPCPSSTGGVSPVAANQHLVHKDNEPVWFNKPTYDAAELRYHLAGIQRAPSKTQEPVSTSPPAAPAERRTPAPCCPWRQDKTMAVNFLANENIWFDKYKYDDAEVQYYRQLSGSVPTNTPVENVVRNSPAVQENGASNILRDIARARENIQKSLAGNVFLVHPQKSAVQGADVELCSRVTSLEKENQSLHKEVEELRLKLSKLELRLSSVEKSLTSTKPVMSPPAQPNKLAPKQPEEDGEDDLDLFGSSDEEESAESERVRQERLRQYADKKSKKPALIAKSTILLDVKPWDDETDMAKLEECVRTVQMDGLVWGASKLVPVGYGIKKLQIQCVVEDDKVGTDELEEEIIKFEDYVQSVDVAAFNKV